MFDVLLLAFPLVLFFLLLAMGMPVAFAIGFAGFVGTTLTLGFGPTMGFLGSIPFGEGASFVLSTIPLFVLMAELAKHSGFAERLFDMCQRFVGHFRGGLGIATVMASAILAAISGSSVASAAAMTSAAAESLEKRGYSTELAMGICCTAGTISTMIPPALALIVFGVLTETSIAVLFIAGIVPGLLTTAAYAVHIYIKALRTPDEVPTSRSYSWKERVSSLGVLSPVVIIGLTVVGGIYLGMLTPTEAGGVGVVATFLVALLYRQMGWSNTNEALDQAVRTSVMVLIIIICSHFFARYLSTTGVTRAMIGYVEVLTVPDYVIMLLALLPYLVLGFFMSGLAALVILIPLTFPILVTLGYNPVWQGIVVVKIIEIGLITPPFGMNVFVAAGARGVEPEVVFRGVFPFVIADSAVILLIILFPELVMYLPYLMFG